MFVTIVDNRVYVKLSRRNLRQLNAMLDRLNARNIVLARKDENGVSLVVQVEEDSDHYDGRDPGITLLPIRAATGDANPSPDANAPAHRAR